MDPVFCGIVAKPFDVVQKSVSGKRDHRLPPHILITKNLLFGKRMLFPYRMYDRYG